MELIIGFILALLITWDDNQDYQNFYKYQQQLNIAADIK